MYGHIVRFGKVFLVKIAVKLVWKDKNTYQFVRKSRRSTETLSESEQKERQVRKNNFQLTESS